MKILKAENIRFLATLDIEIRLIALFFPFKKNCLNRKLKPNFKG